MGARRRGPVLALDLGVRTGWAVGLPGDRPTCGAVRLKLDCQDRGRAASNFWAWLSKKIAEERPVMIVKEAILPLAGFKRVRSGEVTIKMHMGLHFMVEGLCDQHGIELISAHPSTVRKHFCGWGHAEDRPETKQMVIRRARALGLLARNSWDDDRADALAMHDWACSMHYRFSASQSELVMFGDSGK